MRVLAKRLSDATAATRDEALSDRRAGPGEEALGRLSDLVNRSRDLHRRLDNYSDRPRYVRAEVRELDGLVRDVDSRMRSDRPSGRAAQNWREVLDVMDRMNRLAIGEDVELPPIASDTGPVFPTSPSDESWRSGSVLRDREVEDFRRMTRELAVRATLAAEGAERARERTSASDRLLRDLQDFRDRVRDLERRVDTATVDRADVRPVVERLYDDARRFDREMRDGGVYTGIWGDWTEVLLLLRRLVDLSRV
ncbi:MAG: hypothetical protein ABR576_14640 [Thermoanaerobaculia bacterium]